MVPTDIYAWRLHRIGQKDLENKYVTFWELNFKSSREPEESLEHFQYTDTVF